MNSHGVGVFFLVISIWNFLLGFSMLLLADDHLVWASIMVVGVIGIVVEPRDAPATNDKEAA